MKKLLCAFMLLPVLLAAQNLPWKTSTLWSEDSTPLPLDGKVRRLEKYGDEFMAATTGGVGLYAFKDGKYIRRIYRKADVLRNAVKVGRYIVYIDSKGLTIWDTILNKTKSSRYFGSDDEVEGRIIMAPVTKRSEVLIGNGNRLWIVKTGRAYPHKTSMIARSGKSALTAMPDGTALFYNNKKLYRYDGKFTEIPLPQNFTQQEAMQLGVSADGKYLYFGAPFVVYDLQNNKVVFSTNYQHVRYGFVHDTKRDHLYIGSWTVTCVFANASTPEKMKEIGVLDSMNDVTLYTHRDNKPSGVSGSMLYLDKTDEFLFAGDPGVTILGTTPHVSKLVEDKGWEKYRRDNTKYSGDTYFHEFLRKNRLVIGYTSTTHRITGEVLDNMKKNGMNALVLNIFNIEHHRFFPPTNVRDTVKRVAKLCAERGMLFLANMTPYNVSMNNTFKEFRRLVLPDGKNARIKNDNYHPSRYSVRECACLLDEEYISKAGFRYNMEEIAKLSLEVPIAGIIFEMGDGWTATTFRAGMNCYCDYCFGEFFKSRKEAVPQVAPNKRLLYFYKNKKHREYVKFQGERLAAICKNAADSMRKINPKLVAGVMLPESGSDYTKQWLYSAFVRGFQHKGQPVPVISEQTYAVAYVPEFTGKVEERYKKAGLETVLIPGVINYWLTPAVFQKRLKEYLEYTPAALIYHVGRWHKPYDAEEFYHPRRAVRKFRSGKYTKKAYMDLPDPLKKK